MRDKELNSVIDRAEDEYQKLKDRVIEQGLEIEKLNNIINELEKLINGFFDKTYYTLHKELRGK